MKLIKIHDWFRGSEIFFISTALTTGLIFSIIVPPLWGFDEPSHFTRAYQISKGDLIPDNHASGKEANLMSVNFNDLAFHAVSDIGEEKDTSIFARKDVNDLNSYDVFKSQKFSDNLSPAANSATYSPSTYPLSIVSIFISRSFDLTIGMTIFVARLASLISYIAIVYTAIRVLRSYKIKWVVVSIGLLPVMVFQASVLSADTIINALALLLFALLFRLFKERKKSALTNKMVIATLLVAILLPTIKINYIFLSFAVLLIPTHHFTTQKIATVSRTLTVLVATLATAAWAVVSNATSTSIISPRSDGLAVSSGDQINFLISHPFSFLPTVARSLVASGDNYIQQVVGVLGWNYVQTPLIIGLLSLGMIIFFAISAREEIADIRGRLIIISTLSLASILSIFFTLYIAFTPIAKSVIDGVQGRYMVPFLLPFVLLFVAYLPVKSISKAHTPAVPMILTASILLSSVLYYCMATY